MALDPTQETIDELRTENQQLKQELQRRIEAEKRSDEIKSIGIRALGTLLYPLFDRKKVISTFTRLVDTTSRFGGERTQWPAREEVQTDTRNFLVAFMRFLIRRRMFMFFVTMLALLIPATQIYLIFQQNEIIRNQNKFFEIQVYDIVARSMTGGEVSAKQITGALLAKSDLDFLGGIITEVFGEHNIENMPAVQGRAATVRRLQDAAYRGYLILSVARAVDDRAGQVNAEEIDAAVWPMYEKVIKDATLRIPELLRFSKEDALADTAQTEEVFRYLLNLGMLMRQGWSIANAVNKEEAYFETLAPLLAHTSSRLYSGGSEGNPFVTVFYEQALRELLLDLAIKPRLGQPPQIPAGNVDPLFEEGFALLKQGVGDQRGVRWANLRRMIGIDNR